MTVPIAAFQVYSVVCTDRMWQKHKSFKDKAKASTKTGLGPTLKAAEKAWGNIKWAQLDAKKLKAKTQQTMGNQSLSNSAKNQAEVIRNGMRAMKTRLETVNLSDFDQEIQRL